MDYLPRIAALAAPVLLCACVSMPTGPSVTSLPGSGKTFDQFRADDADCRQFATNAIGGTNAAEAQADSAVKSGAVGAAVGALAGAAIGGHEGVGPGAGVGLLAGAMAGSAAADASGYGVQRRYDNAYIQCMYAKGNRVPMAAPSSPGYSSYRYHSQAVPGYYPPPPPPGAETAQAMPLPPPRASAPPSPPPAGGDRLFIYPRSGQSEAQTARDRSECGRWASQQTGYDSGRADPADPRRSDYRRAISACLEGRGYTVR
jgi:outer membrane lipoprotein SlyB